MELYNENTGSVGGSVRPLQITRTATQRGKQDRQVFDFGRKPKDPEETHKDTGRHAISNQCTTVYRSLKNIENGFWKSKIKHIRTTA